MKSCDHRADSFRRAVGHQCIGDPGHDHSPDLRVWKDKDGLFEIEASFVVARDDKVQLCKHDGLMVWVPLDKLSEADRAWVQNRIEAIRNLNGADTEVKGGTAPSESQWSGSIPAVAAVFGLVMLAGACRFLGRRRGGATRCLRSADRVDHRCRRCEG